MSLDATVGGTGSNSYVTQAVASSYLADRLDATEWLAGTSGERDSALIMACVRIETESFQGSRVTYSQRLAWPRYMVYDRDDVVYDHTTIPLPVQQAQIELALALTKQPTLQADTGLEGFINVKLGSLDVTPRFIAAAALPALVKRLLIPVLAAGAGVRVDRA